MRAYVSDPCRAYDRVQSSKIKPTQAAFAEASMILAESEPQSLYSRAGRLDCGDLCSGWRVASEVREALAESLAFILPELDRLADESIGDEHRAADHAHTMTVCEPVAMSLRNLATLRQMGA